MAPPPTPPPPPELVAASFHSLFFFSSLCLPFGFSSYIVHLRCTSEGVWFRCLTRPLILSLFVSVFCPAVLLSALWVVSCTQITCIQPFDPLLADISCLLFLFRKCFLFVCLLFLFFFSFFPFLSHHVFFLFYWPFRTRLIACLIRAALLHLSFCLHLFISRCFVIGSSD